MQKLWRSTWETHTTAAYILYVRFCFWATWNPFQKQIHTLNSEAGNSPQHKPRKIYIFPANKHRLPSYNVQAAPVLYPVQARDSIYSSLYSLFRGICKTRLLTRVFLVRPPRIALCLHDMKPESLVEENTTRHRPSSIPGFDRACPLGKRPASRPLIKMKNK